MRYLSVGENANRHSRYWTFEKSPRLDELIQLYREIRYK